MTDQGVEKIARSYQLSRDIETGEKGIPCTKGKLVVKPEDQAYFHTPKSTVQHNKGTSPSPHLAKNIEIQPPHRTRITSPSQLEVEDTGRQEYTKGKSRATSGSNPRKPRNEPPDPGQ